MGPKLGVDEKQSHTQRFDQQHSLNNVFLNRPCTSFCDLIFVDCLELMRFGLISCFKVVLTIVSLGSFVLLADVVGLPKLLLTLVTVLVINRLIICDLSSRRYENKSSIEHELFRVISIFLFICNISLQ